MKFILRKRTIIIMVLCVLLGVFLSYKFYRFLNPSSKPWIVADANDTSKKFITKDALIKKIQQKQKLITTEVEVNAKVTVDNSWGDLDIFKKIQNISFTGKGLYTVDLSNLSSKNISVNYSTNVLTVTIPEPEVEVITIDDNKTVYETPEKGLLRFGDIKLTPEEHEVMLQNVKKTMQEKMLEETYMDKALSNSKTSMQSLVKSLIGSSKTSYMVNINFTKNK